MNATICDAKENDKAPDMQIIKHGLLKTERQKFFIKNSSKKNSLNEILSHLRFVEVVKLVLSR